MTGERLLTQAAGASALGISKQAIGKWAARPEAPKSADGRLRWPAFPRWREAELVRQARLDRAPATAKEADARAAWMATRARREELKYLQDARVLAKVDDFERVAAREYMACRQVMLSWPQRVAADLVGLRTLPEATVLAHRLVLALMASLREIPRAAATFGPPGGLESPCPLCSRPRTASSDTELSPEAKPVPRDAPAPQSKPSTRKRRTT